MYKDYSLGADLLILFPQHRVSFVRAALAAVIIIRFFVVHIYREAQHLFCQNLMETNDRGCIFFLHVTSEF